MCPANWSISLLRADHIPLIDWRRAAVYLLLLSLLLSLLSACGWRLRGALGVALDLPPVLLQTQDVSSALLDDLRRGLLASNVTIVDNRQAAGLVLMVKNERRERRVLSVGGDGKVSEYELQYAMSYAVFDADGKVLAPMSTLDSTRDYRFDESDVLAKDEEESQLFDYMRTTAVQNLLRRLQSLAMTQAQARDEGAVSTPEEPAAPAVEPQPDAN